MKSLVRMTVLLALVIVTGSAVAQVPVAGVVSTGGGLRLGMYDGGSLYTTLPINVQNTALYKVLTVGQMVVGSTWDVILLRTDTNRYYRWSFDAVGNRIAVANIREAWGTRGVGVADFDRNGHKEFVVQDVTTRVCQAFELDWNTGALIRRINMGEVGNATYDAARGIVDWDGDDRQDIVVQSTTTREACYQGMGGFTPSFFITPFTNGAETVIPSGTIVGATHVGANPQLHIKAANGTIRVWHMDGTLRLLNTSTNGWNASWSFVAGG